VQVHRVPAAQLIQRTVEDRADGVGWAARVVRLLRAIAPADPADPAGWPLWRQLLPHILAVTDPARHLADAAVEVAWLLEHGAGFLLARGEPRPALALATDSYDLYRDRLGPDHPDTQTSARTLTAGLHALGRHDQARRLLEEASIDPPHTHGEHPVSQVDPIGQMAKFWNPTPHGRRRHHTVIGTYLHGPGPQPRARRPPHHPRPRSAP
jgi:hypothetical protein